jgi:hypothetical protein
MCFCYLIFNACFDIFLNELWRLKRTKMAKKNKKNREVKIHVFEIFKADIQSSEKKKESINNL